MIPEIEFFIDNYITEGQRLIVIDAFKLLEELEVDEVQSDFVEVLMQESEMEKAALCDLFIHKLIVLLDSIAQLHGIEFDQDTPTEFKTKVLRGLSLLPDYIDKQAINRVLENNEDTVEKLIELLRLVAIIDPDNDIQYFASVNDTIMSRLYELCEEAAEPVESNDSIQTLRMLRTLFGDEQPKTMQVVIGGLSAGLYFKEYISYLPRELSHLKPSEAAREIIVLLYMSKDGKHTPAITYKDNSNLIFDSIEMVTKVDVQINRIMMELDRIRLEAKNVKV